jgi:hypothetical protein
MTSNIGITWGIPTTLTNLAGTWNSVCYGIVNGIGTFVAIGNNSSNFTITNTSTTGTS